MRYIACAKRGLAGDGQREAQHQFARHRPAACGAIFAPPATAHRIIDRECVHGSPLLCCYFTVSTALSLMNPAVVAVIVVLPAARPVATPRSVIVAFVVLLLVHTTPGVPMTVTGKGLDLSLPVAQLAIVVASPASHHTAGEQGTGVPPPAASLVGALIPRTRTGMLESVLVPLPS